MNQGLRKVFRIFTILLLGVCLWTAYANVFSDDTAVRAKANDLARKTAGCGDKCKVTSIRGNRGMLDETTEYDVEGPGAGHYVVVCRRAQIVVGEYGCEVTGGK
ncbi:hypothetical protein BH11MYX4_BH11MYX4_66750 [soil metagenome]